MALLTECGVREALWAINIALLRSASLGVALFLYKTAIRSMLREVF